LVSRVKHVALHIKDLYNPGMSSDNFKNSRQILRDLEKASENKREIAKERNSLEAFIYEGRDQINEKEELLAVSTPEQREKIIEDLRLASEWLDEQGQATTALSYRNKLKEIRSGFDKVVYRSQELQYRDASINHSMSALEHWNSSLENITQIREVTEEEETNIRKLISDLKTWIAETSEKQSHLKVHEDPVFSIMELKTKYDVIEKEYKKLFRRGYKRPPTIPKEKKIMDE